jgi:hypothetical protein
MRGRFDFINVLAFVISRSSAICQARIKGRSIDSWRSSSLINKLSLPPDSYVLIAFKNLWSLSKFSFHPDKIKAYLGVGLPRRLLCNVRRLS